MGTLIMKYMAILSLTIAAALRPSINLQLLLGFVICASGVAVAAQAIRAKKYVWSAVFVAIAIIFNPVFMFQPAFVSHRGLSAACVLAFVLSLFILKNMPRRTIASITQDSESNSL